MYAIIKTGGKQYKVAEGDELHIEKLDVEQGEQVIFDEVLMISNDADLTVGNPFISSAKVEATVVAHGRGKKIRVFKFKPKNNGYKRTQGHRQPFTAVKINSIVL